MMDQKRIGEFIAVCRKEKGLTQQQLAEKLGITNKSVSKWETGNALPDPSLYHSLCETLDISIDELFSAEKGTKEADEYLIRLLESRLYDENSGVTFKEFHHALRQMSEVTVTLSRFASDKEAIEYLMRESGLPFEECSKAYDFYMHLDRKGKVRELQWHC